MTYILSGLNKDKLSEASKMEKEKIDEIIRNPED